MQEIMSKRFEEYDRDIEASVSLRRLLTIDTFTLAIQFLQFDMFNLKLMHLERCKYISANGFFPINYSMMLNVSRKLSMVESIRKY